MLDPGSTHTIISHELVKTLDLKLGNKVELNLETIHKDKKCPSHEVQLKVPTAVGKIKISGHVLDRKLTIMPQPANIKLEFETLWPNLEQKIKDQILRNQVKEQIDILIGMNNIWKLVLEERITHPSKRFGIINTYLGWTIGGEISTTEWQQVPHNEMKNYCIVNKKDENPKLKKFSQNCSNKKRNQKANRIIHMMKCMQTKGS